VKQRQVAVLGLGRFGQAAAVELTRLGHEVLAVDASERAVLEVAEHVTHSAQADVTDADALRELGVGEMDVAIVAISGVLEASILCTVQVKELGVPRVIAKAATALHGSILERVGADRVVYPERETGIRLAHSFTAAGVRDYLDVAPGYGIARVPVSDALSGKSLAESDLRRTCGVTVVALRRGGSVTLNPPAAEVLRAGDELIVAGLDEDLERLPGGGAGPGGVRRAAS
jgi:trk system potassium uptake protein